MKKISILSALLVMIIYANAQLSYGARAAVTVSKLKFSNGKNIMDHKPVLFGGLFGNYRLSKKFSAQLDVLAFVEKSKIKTFKTEVKASRKDFVLRIPVMLQYNIARGVRIGTGPQIGFAVKADRKPADWKWAVVTGYQIPSVKGLSVSTKYSFGIDGLKNFDRDIFNNSVLQLGVAYSISRKINKT